MQHEVLTYQADGVSMRGQLFFDADSADKPGVLVFPDAFGLGEHALARARRLADKGYMALACDLHGDGLVFGDFQQMMGALGPLMANPDTLRTRARAAFAALSTRGAVSDRIAAIGFCLGGTMAFELARAGAEIRAAIGFHGGLETKAPASKGGIGARILACVGADDPMIPAEQRAAFEAEMRDAGADWALNVYGNTVHAFTDPASDQRNMPHVARYSESADRSSYRAMSELLNETLLS